MKHFAVALLASLVAFAALGVQAAEGFAPEAVDGYRDIWYANQKTEDEYVYKYSGGLGTYCAKHIPMAAYAPEAEKTFFVYGGVTAEGDLSTMVSCYNHKTGMVPRPRQLLVKNTTDAHDNPVIALDDEGHVWVFASSHGTSRPSFIYKSLEPYSIERFEEVLETNFSYPQPFYVPGKGFLFLQTYYKGGRGLNWQTSEDGRTWTERTLLSHIAEGHYQVSWPSQDSVGTAFNYHPPKKGLNFRTNLYYIETPDMGETWRAADGTAIAPPLTEVQNPALVHDYESEGLKVYIKDLNYAADGRPIILHIASEGWEPGPENGPRTWRTARWTGEDWDLRDITTSDNNYDMGSLYVEPDGAWLLIAPTETGPQPFNPGGEVAVWRSEDQGKTWEQTHQLTHDSEYNHTYVRRPLKADDGFKAYWADGHGRQPSDSRLYFWDAKKDQVYRLPAQMDADEAAPEPVFGGSKE